MISKQAQDFWTLLKTYPKQIQMPLSQAREADTHSEDFTSEPAGVTFRPLPISMGSGPKSRAQRRDGPFFISSAADMCLAPPQRAAKPAVILRSRQTRAC